jgi:4-amino-4-deoxy-L-arabinose transferase-like glycosyltransferase
MDPEALIPAADGMLHPTSFSKLIGGSNVTLSRRLFVALVLVGVLFRVFFAVYPGNAPRAPWSGGGDAAAYLTLAQNISSHKGFAYAGQPSAFRAPGYPLILSVFIEIFGRNYILAVRCLQFLEGLLIALLCAAMAGELLGETAGKLALLIALFLPTLVQMTSEVLTETTAATFAAAFLFFLVRYVRTSRWESLAWMSAAIGIGALVRSNVAFVGIAALIVVALQENGRARVRRLGLVVLIPCVLISPWIIRNLVVFHGRVIYSTQGGFALMSGVLIPQGRALPGDTEKIQAAVGWKLPTELETNDLSRLDLPSEVEIDRRCMRAGRELWGNAGWKAVPVTIDKLSYFWLSTDQIFWTGAFSRLQRALRGIGVLAYWAVLCLAIPGLVFLKRSPRVGIARAFLFYMLVVTVLHVPFNMNTRYRVPLIDPLLAVLAGIGCASMLERLTSRPSRLETQEEQLGPAV